MQVTMLSEKEEAFMIQCLGLLGVLGLGVGIVAAVVTPRPVFVVRVRGDAVVVGRGQVSAAFASDCLRLCQENNLSAATIKGFRHRGHIRLKFCRRVPKRVRQKFRNAWTFYS
jgi:hypothetical protein